MHDHLVERLCCGMSSTMDGTKKDSVEQEGVSKTPPNTLELNPLEKNGKTKKLDEVQEEKKQVEQASAKKDGAEQEEVPKTPPNTFELNPLEKNDLYRRRMKNRKTKKLREVQEEKKQVDQPSGLVKILFRPEMKLKEKFV